MAKTDIEDAFRILLINPSDYHLLGFSWEEKFYLPMGASSSCQLFEKLRVALQWIMQTKYKGGGMSHILDVFFLHWAQGCFIVYNLTHFLYIWKKIGVPIKMSKTQPPSTKIIIYGIEIDSKKMQARLHIDKVEKN